MTTGGERKRERYEPVALEARWLARWKREGQFASRLSDASRPKYYNLTMYPYPSGDRLHIGHAFNYYGCDTHGRYMRMRGHNVFQPFGYDSFGLPAENYAIKHGVPPAESTRRNIDSFRAQLDRLGVLFDPASELETSDPGYYRWTQWLFLELFRAGLAVRKKAPVNWCPADRTVLANEQVVEGRCERCGSEVIQQDRVQWFFRITEYAERLLRHEGISWPETTIAMQRNWIGRSEGAHITFKLGDEEAPTRTVEVFTTRPDTLFGANYLVLAPEHELVPSLTAPEQREAVEAYVAQARRAKEVERLSTERLQTGVPLGTTAVNPANGERVPVWIADYVLVSYGTGAIMGVPAHDERDFAFATRYGLEIRQVIQPPPGVAAILPYTGPGNMVHSGPYDGLDSATGKRQLVADLEATGAARAAITYRLRDWLLSRQRYWGAPIPIVICPTCGDVAVPVAHLPVLLPETDDFTPTEAGESPLAKVASFVDTACPRCGGQAKREVDTMDTFVDSSWYFLRYLSPSLEDAPFDRGLVDRWLPVDHYLGGSEHAVMHLLYSRFITKVLYDLGHIGFDEPFTKLVHQGKILGVDGQRMSKSRGNTASPDDYLTSHGSDTFRLYCFFLGPYTEGGSWNDRGIAGTWRFLNRLWHLIQPVGGGADLDLEAAGKLRATVHRTVRQVTRDLPAFHLNTVVSDLMKLEGAMSEVPTSDRRGDAWVEAQQTLVLLLAPMAPHLADELWQRLGHSQSVHLQAWPAFDVELTLLREITLVVQINGKVRERVLIPAGTSREDATSVALALPRIAAALGGQAPRRVVVVADKLVNLVV